MIRRILLRAGALTLCLAATGSAAHAQFPAVGPSTNPYARGVPSYSRPVVSPYLNLLRNDISFTESYFLRVQPELQLRQGINTLNQDLANTNRNLATAEATINQDLPTTGHAANFMNLGHYFGGGGRSGGQAQAGVQTGRQTRPTTQGMSRGTGMSGMPR